MPDDPAIPTAATRPERRISSLWIIPLLALLIAAWLGWNAWRERGLIVTIHFDQGHGLEPGDAVRYRGIDIGEVRSIELNPDLSGIDVVIGLNDQADRIAREDTRFWIMRPQLGLTGVEGLDTILGGRYVAVLPSDDSSARSMRAFTGLEYAPVIDGIDDDDLIIILEAMERGGLARGTPIRYREVRIGVVMEVKLAGDGSAVEARAHIDSAYANLIRDNTRFWDSGWVDADLSISGLRIDVGSLESVLVGGVSLATPNRMGGSVDDGHRFTLHKKPEDDWLRWQPAMTIGAAAGDGLTMPEPISVRLFWEQGVFKRDKTRTGWVLPVDRGVLGPADLFTPIKPRADTVAFSVDGVAHALPKDLIERGPGVVFAPLDLTAAATPWPTRRIRAGAAPEDALIVTQRGDAKPLAAARLTAGQSRWWIDEARHIAESWHGAPVVARADGALVGVLIVEGDDDDERYVSLLNPGAGS